MRFCLIESVEVGDLHPGGIIGRSLSSDLLFLIISFATLQAAANMLRVVVHSFVVALRDDFLRLRDFGGCQFRKRGSPFQAIKAS